MPTFDWLRDVGRFKDCLWMGWALLQEPSHALSDHERGEIPLTDDLIERLRIEEQ